MRRPLIVAALLAGCAIAAHAEDTSFTDWRIGYTFPGKRGIVDETIDGSTVTYSDAWDVTGRVFTDVDHVWQPGVFGLAFGGGLAFEDRRRSPRADGAGPPGFKGGKNRGPIMKYNVYQGHISGGPTLRLGDWGTLELMLHAGIGAATFAIEFQGVATSATNPYYESGADLSLIIADGIDSPFIGLSVGGISSYSQHKMTLQGYDVTYEIYNNDYSASLFVGYRF